MSEPYLPLAIPIVNMIMFPVAIQATDGDKHALHLLELIATGVILATECPEENIEILFENVLNTVRRARENATNAKLS